MSDNKKKGGKKLRRAVNCKAKRSRQNLRTERNLNKRGPSPWPRTPSRPGSWDAKVRKDMNDSKQGRRTYKRLRELLGFDPGAPAQRDEPRLLPFR